MNDHRRPDSHERPCRGAASGSRWPTDLTRVCERMVDRLVARGGVAHPVAAAVVLAARGHLGLDREAFAARLGLAPEAVAAAEAGRIPWEDLPDVVGDLLESMPRVELLALADLDRELRSAAAAASAERATPHPQEHDDQRHDAPRRCERARGGDDGRAVGP